MDVSYERIAGFDKTSSSIQRVTNINHFANQALLSSALNTEAFMCDCQVLSSN